MNIFASDSIPEIVEHLINTKGREEGVDIVLFVNFESYFRTYMKEHNLRAIYRGPRISNNAHLPTITRLCDAKRVTFYSN